AFAAPRAAPYFFFPSRRRHTRSKRDWSSDVCSSDLGRAGVAVIKMPATAAALNQARRAEMVARCGWTLEFIMEVSLQEGAAQARSEERRVGKECAGRGEADRCNNEGTQQPSISQRSA